jgi:hypothetical protein
MDIHLNWKNHIDQLAPKLSAACYAVRSMLHLSNTDTLNLFCSLLLLNKVWNNFLG